MFWEPIVGVFALSVSLLIHDLTPQEYRETGSLFASCVRRDDSMWIIELTDAECEAVLERAVVARLATCADSRPYIVPISVKYERAASDRFLYSFANLGQKVRWMRSNPLVCVEVDELGDRVHWTTVVITGRFEELDPVQHVRTRRAPSRCCTTGASGGYRPPRERRRRIFIGLSCTGFALNR